MKSSVKKMVLVDYNDYNKLLSHPLSSSQQMDPERQRIFDNREFSDENKIALDSYILRNNNRMRQEQLQQQKDKMSQIIENLKSFVTTDGSKPKMIDTSTQMKGLNYIPLTSFSTSTSPPREQSPEFSIPRYESTPKPPKKKKTKKPPKFTKEHHTRAKRGPGDTTIPLNSPLHPPTRKKTQKKKNQSGSGLTMRDYNDDIVWLQMPF